MMMISTLLRNVTQDLGLALLQGGISFLYATASRSALGPTQTPIHWVPEALSPEVKRPERKADHSSACSTEVKNAWNYNYIRPYVFPA